MSILVALHACGSFLRWLNWSRGRWIATVVRRFRSVISRSMCMFFFFQAEDGIRDHCVTGVQTCALPISRYVKGAVDVKNRFGNITATQLNGNTTISGGNGNIDVSNVTGSLVVTNSFRSEERRVGKEGRSRWSPYH